MRIVTLDAGIVQPTESAGDDKLGPAELNPAGPQTPTAFPRLEVTELKPSDRFP